MRVVTAEEAKALNEIREVYQMTLKAMLYEFNSRFIPAHTDIKECICPFVYMHDKADRLRTAYVYLGEKPEVRCTDGNCRIELEAFNKEFRRRIFNTLKRRGIRKVSFPPRRLVEPGPYQGEYDQETLFNNDAQYDPLLTMRDGDSG